MNCFLNLNKISFYKIKLSLIITAVVCIGVYAQAQKQQAANAFTVQLASLQSQEDSQAVRDALRQAGYPAYVIEDKGVYQLRVGHFLNPEAAQQYALGLLSTPSFQDDFAKNFELGFGTSFEPMTLVADGVAQNEFAMSARLLMNYPYVTGLTSLKVHEWANEERALRFQGRLNSANFEASYLVLNNLWDQSAFPAWRANGEADGSLVRVFNDSLWPEDIEGVTVRELAKLQEDKLEQIAEAMEISAASFGLSIFNEPGRGRPYVIRAQRVDASSGFVESYPALGIPSMTGVKPEGPELKWFDRGFVDEVPGSVTPVVTDIFGLLEQKAGSEVLSIVEGLPLSLEGRNWQSFAFESLTAIRVQNGDSWLAIAGTPLWAYQDYVLVAQAGEVLLYRIELTQ